jgi:GTP-binding protein
MPETPSSADPLVIRSLEFIGPMAEAGGWRPDSLLPEIAFVGRSNVGKSSLLNKLVRRKAFARVSNTPGRTREINFFKVNGTFVLADLPGYGYARISKERKSAWKPLIEGFLRYSPMLRGVVQLIDARHEPTDDDRHMLDFLADLGVPTLVVFTKIDKLKPTERTEQVPALLASLGLEEEQALLFSARTGEGRDELASAVVSLCDAPAWRTAEDAARDQAEAEAAAAAKAERDAIARTRERSEYRR